MLINGSLQKAERFEIQAYKKPKDLKNLKNKHVAFTGSPQKHPYDPSKVILIVRASYTRKVWPSAAS